MSVPRTHMVYSLLFCLLLLHGVDSSGGWTPRIGFVEEMDLTEEMEWEYIINYILRETISSLVWLKYRDHEC